MRERARRARKKWISIPSPERPSRSGLGHFSALIPSQDRPLRPKKPQEPEPQGGDGGGRNGDRCDRKHRTCGPVNRPAGEAASRLKSGPVNQRADWEGLLNPVARDWQPAASQFSGRVARGAIPDFDKFLGDRLLWLHTNVARHDDRGNHVATHRNCLPEFLTHVF